MKTGRRFTESLREPGKPIDVLVYSLAFANREDCRSFVDTQRDGFLLAQNVSAYSLVAMARAVVALMTNGGSIMTLTLCRIDAGGAELQRDGVKASLEASMRQLSGARSRPGRKFA